MPHRLSPQLLDPLGGVTAQAFTWVLTLGAFATSIALTIIHREEYRQAAPLVAAFAALVAAGLVLVMSSAPRRAPFTWRSALALHLLCLAAVGFEAASQWGANATVRSDWGPIAFALLVMATGCFRPAVEILAMTAVSSVLVAGTTMAGSIAAQATLPPGVYGGLTAGPLLAAGAGAAAFSATLVSRLLSWREHTSGLRAENAARLRSRVRADLRVERLTLIEGEVAPFLRELLARGETDAASAIRARELGEALRGALVREADGVWLDDLVVSLDDPDGLATRMDDTERAALEAVCAALARRRPSAVVGRSGDRILLTLRWERGGPGRIGPELQAMVRSIFPGARMHLTSRVVELEFDG
ncbi:hypothetical protein [Protaetiibacter intestinalis]|uniref:Uncharacterized protein n=1 Tax=Protaetiibacter intestinalis TaxID=2419774 RepID=A0A387B8P9_9MICO|nr:hypothetical protein [Protaetiibacter intestinalis]AYF98138.1 hypothetical protein D7I47_07655 [Protaetiibacter intestinalis]